MILVPCPWCGPRNADEFRYAGETVSRPDPTTASPAQWRDYVYLRTNAQGEAAETWYHRAGCRRYFRLVRDRQTNAFRTASPAGSAPLSSDRPQRGDGTP